MEKKTKNRLKRRLDVLEKQHIDTCIFFESESKTETEECIKYLQKVGHYNYKGYVSFPVLSEILAVILRTEDYNKRQDALEFINRIFKEQNIKLYSPKEIENILTQIKETDSRIDPLDKHILACAIEDKANVLITTDVKLIENVRLENTFNIKICHPRDLI